MKNIKSNGLLKKDKGIGFLKYRNFDFEKKIVISTIDKFLPIIFWLGFSFIFLESLHQNIDMINWNFFDGLLGFCKIFIPLITGHFILFYIIYSIKDIKENLENKEDNLL